MANNGIEEIITTLYEMVQDAWSLPLGNEKCVVERDKVLDLLDEISNQLPGELKQAKTIVESRNEVITNAKREAENILKQAEQRAKQMISREEITRQAAQQGRIPALSRRGVDAEVSRLHAPAQEFVDHRQCVQLHRSVPPYRKGTLIEGPFDGSNIA